MVFLWIAWLFILFRAIGDIFRRRDLSGGGKALWLLLVILVPYLGTFAYLITQGGHMAERDQLAATEAQAHLDEYVKAVAGGPASEIERANSFRDEA